MVEPLIYEKPCLIYEALNFAKKRVNNIKADGVDQCVDQSKAIKLDQMVQSLQAIDIKHPALFRYLNHTKVSIAELLCYSFGLTIMDMMADDYFSALNKAIDDAINHPVGTITLTNHLDLDLNHPCQTFLDALLKLNLDDHDKLMLIEAIYHHDVTLQQLFESLHPLVQAINTMVETMNLSSYIDYFKKHDAFKFLENGNMHIHGKIMVLPSLIDHTNVLVNISADDTILVFYGLSIDQSKLNNYDFYNDELSRRMDYLIKVLADKSKMKLIGLLKQQPMYGAQLAQATGLKPSTISYHLDALMNAGMVKTTRDNNRIWFEYDKDHTLMLLDELRHNFD